MGIYLDNAATSYPKPEAVYRAVDRFMREIGASSGRGAYRQALLADKVVFSAREALGKLFGIRDASRIVFTSNATESLNLAVKGLLKAGDHVVASSMEHNAVWRPLKRLEAERGIEITVAPCAKDGSLRPEDVIKAIRPNTRLVVMTHASNVTGTLLPVGEVGAAARDRGVLFLVDAAQTAGTCPIDAGTLGIDLLAFTGHKGLFGPTGTGGLYIREGVDLLPFKEGGTGGESILEHQPDHLPDRFEAGTLNISGIAGLLAGVDFILTEGIDRIRGKEKELTGHFLRALEIIPGIEVYGPKDPEKQVGVVSLNISGVMAQDVAYVLDEVYGVMVRSGLHCAPMAHRTIGTIDRGTVRFGIGYFNTIEEIDTMVQALAEIAGKTLTWK
ncbi:MAG: aminotransferase class V-fold PLP-dependent enzyme [Firmicutes bacterium]|nr:aminotransferase class V-fold PLP-dependent enzyme [Bacillota bacterium]